MMHRWLLFFAVFISLFCHGQNAEFTLRADSTGWTQVCIKGKFNGTVVVQDYRWNKWAGMSHLSVNTTKDTCFITEIVMHSGMNRLRLEMHPVDTAIKWFRTADISVSNGNPLPNPGVKSQYGLQDTIHLPQLSKWEMYDKEGTPIRNGQSKDIGLNGLVASNYYLNYDNLTIEFVIYNVAHR